MKNLKIRKRIAGLTIGFSLVFSQISLAELLVAPLPDKTQSGQSTVSETNIAQPVIQSQGAVVINGATGEVLFGKNENTQYYPASITKLMTALLVIENCSLNDTVTFSKTATTNLESGAVSLGLSEGDKLTVEQCLYGLLLKSANEIGNALAEHVSGSVSSFADMMNARAAALGCRNTHFVNPHGLNNSQHYTTPYDMALIANAAFQSDTLLKIDSTTSYQFPAIKNAAARTITMGHKMFYKTDSRYYEGIIGGKTGYTSLAGNTLVTGAERNGIRLIAVVMKSSSTHYADTKALLDYGFATGGTLSHAADTQQAVTNDETAIPETTASGEIGPGITSILEASASGWEYDGTGWIYKKADGVQVSAQWIHVDGNYYWIDPDGHMASSGWRQLEQDEWYYFRSSGIMAADYWAKGGEQWFYLGADGKILKNCTTPDGYKVDEQGAWIQ